MKKIYRNKISNKNILIVGGAGFIGSYLAEECLRQKVNKIIIVDNLSVGKKENLKEIKSKILFFKKDAENYKFLENIIKKYKIDYAFNLATIALPFSFKHPRKTFETNTKITLNLLEILRKNLFVSLCHFSSSEVYGSAKYTPMDENHPKNPTTTYAAGKYSSDLALLSYCKMFNIDAFIVRPFNNYGPRQLITRDEIGVIPKTIKRIFYKKNPIIYGDGKQTRDFIFVINTVKYVLKAFTKIKSGETINISNNNPINIKNLIKKISNLSLYKSKIKYQKNRVADVFWHHGDNKKLKKIINLEREKFDKNLKLTVDYYINYLKNEK